MATTIRIAETTPAELARVRDFYRSTGYAGAVGAADLVLIAEDEAAAERALVGVVRLVLEHETRVLRGMRVAPSHQRHGIGARLLAAVDAALASEPCYCLPYQHLLAFYGRIGFREIDPRAAPPFLAERLRDYRARRPEKFSLMVRPGPTDLTPGARSSAPSG